MGTQLAMFEAAVAPAPKLPDALVLRPAHDDGIERGAVISACEKYRYLITRSWGEGRVDLWCCLNPSDADAYRDDPSLCRMMNFSKAWGSGGLEVVNLCAFRSPHPDALYDVSDPIGPENDRYLTEAAERCAKSGGRIVAGWGASIRFDEFAPKDLFGRDQHVLEVLRRFGPIWCLGRTSSGAPKHPLARGRSRVPDNFQPEPFLP